MGPFVAFDPGTGAGPLTRPPYGANMAFRREAFEKYGGFRVDLGRSGSRFKAARTSSSRTGCWPVGSALRYEPGAVVRHPVPECRMQKKYVLRWWFWYGRSEVAESGPPSDAKWFLGGVPLNSFRRLVRWKLQWMISLGASRRFACQRNVWYIAGTIVACYRWRRPEMPAAADEWDRVARILSGIRRKSVPQSNSHGLLPGRQNLVLKSMLLDRARDRPKILFVTSHWPLAAAYGAQQRVLNLGRLLGRFGDVSFVIVPTEQEDEDTVRRTSANSMFAGSYALCQSLRTGLPLGCFGGCGTSLIQRTWQLTPT